MLLDRPRRRPRPRTTWATAVRGVSGSRCIEDGPELLGHGRRRSAPRCDDLPDAFWLTYGDTYLAHRPGVPMEAAFRAPGGRRS